MTPVDPDPLTADAPPSGRTVALGGGAVAPYPTPVDEAASKVGRGNRRSDTKPERALRSELHRRGRRFRKDHPIAAGSVRVRPDMVFTKVRVAVFVDGCFWHSCPEHGRVPRTNRAYWVPKLRRNVERDRAVDDGLAAAGWVVVRVWEHEPVTAAAHRLESLLDERYQEPDPRRPA